MMWYTIFGMACITFINRFAFLTPGFKLQPNAKFKRFLSFSSLAVLTSIWVPIVFQFEQGQLSSAGMDYVVAAFVAAVLSMARLHSLLVVLISVTVFFVLRFAI
ncbi:MAG: AzlD domain-containing protein [Acidiferrobacterales bacterium]|nr:AzlD domain-containing protein [Acidiferrobacterales bacterium]